MAATQNRAQGNDEQRVEVMQGNIAAPRAFQAFEASGEPIQRGLPDVFDNKGGGSDGNRAGQAFLSPPSESEVRFAWAPAGFRYRCDAPAGYYPYVTACPLRGG